MTKQDIFYNRLWVYISEFKQKVNKTEKGGIDIRYIVKWKCKYPPTTLLENFIEQEVTKEEYEYLLKEYEVEEWKILD